MAKAFKPKTGRPRIRIEVAKVQRLAALGCSAEEIALQLGVAPRTIHNRFSSILKVGHNKRDIRLRSALMREAVKGNSAVLIFACKVLLGMREPRDDAVNVQVNTIAATGNISVINDTAKERLYKLRQLLQAEQQRLLAPLPQNGNSDTPRAS